MWYLSLALAAEEAWVTASVVVQVEDQDQASQKLIEQAQKLGGYFSALGENQVVLRVPPDSIEGFFDESWLVVERSYRRQDLSTELVNLRAKLASRHHALDRYMSVLKEAGADSVVAIGREITRSIQDIESLEGQIRSLENKARLGQLSVGFRYTDRSAPVQTGDSSFGWLNMLDLPSMVGAFQWGNGGGYSPGVRLVLPEGFAAWPEKKRLAALSPDDIKVRVRVFKNKPKADLSFWEEAAQNRMRAAGYRQVESGKVEGALPGSWLLLGAPAGEQDYLYLVGIFVDGKKIIAVEAAGLAERFLKEKEALLGMLKTVER